MQILIAYATTDGQTRKIARFAADRLAGQGQAVELPNLEDAEGLDLARFDAAILAGSLHAGGYQKALVRFASADRVNLALMRTLFLSVSLSAVSVAVALSSALLGQLCGVVAAALGAAAGTALWRRPFALPAADGTWIGAAHALFVLAGVHLGSLPWSAAGAALLAPCALLLLRPGAAKRPVGWTAAALLLAGMPLAGAIWFATR